MARHVITSGDIFASDAQTITNAVNCVGVMGAGLARAFKSRYPQMFTDYKARCDAGEVALGLPYVWTPDDGQGPQILNFPTKDHWRQPADLDGITAGLQALVTNYEQWNIASLALPALGCGLGGLDWEEQVKPLMVEHLRDLPIDVSIYAPR